MKVANFLFSLIFIVAVLSCNKKPEKSIIETSENQENSPVTMEIENRFFEEDEIENDIEAIKNYLKYYNTTAVKYDLEVVHLTEINLGIPGGKNYLVLWPEIDGLTEKTLMLDTYVIGENTEIIMERYIGDLINPKALGNNITLQEIPGNHYADIDCFVINDFNNDGKDEILRFGYDYESKSEMYVLVFRISGYDTENDEFENYLYAPIIKFPSMRNIPVLDFMPIECVVGDGINGFKMYMYKEDNENEWVFYIWDEVQRKYIENSIAE